MNKMMAFGECPSSVLNKFARNSTHSGRMQFDVKCIFHMSSFSDRGNDLYDCCFFFSFLLQHTQTHTCRLIPWHHHAEKWLQFWLDVLCLIFSPKSDECVWVYHNCCFANVHIRFLHVHCLAKYKHMRDMVYWFVGIVEQRAQYIVWANIVCANP